MHEGNYDLAINILLKTRKMREENSSFRSSLPYIDILLILLGRVWSMKKNYDIARQHFEQSWQMAQQIGYEPHIARAKLGMAELEFASGNHEKAKSFAHEALKIFTKLGAKREISEIQALLAQIAAQSQQP